MTNKKISEAILTYHFSDTVNLAAIRTMGQKEKDNLIETLTEFLKN